MNARKILVLACTVCLTAPWSTRLFAADGTTSQRHNTKVTALALSPDGSKLVSGGENGTLKVGDSKTGISVIGDKVKVHAWGKCHPTDCDWGTIEATAYAPSVDSALPSNAQALAAVFRQPDLQLQQGSYRLPDDGSDMNNAQVGPFCCTGKIVTVRSTDGDPVGYIHFFFWEGQAYNVEGGSIFPNIIVGVSGLPNFGDFDSEQAKNQITFDAEQMQSQKSPWTQAGILQYRATVLNYETVLGPGSKPYFRGESLRLRIDVQLAP